MKPAKQPIRADDPAHAADQAKEKVIEKIIRDADLKKFDPELEEATHPSKPDAKD
jgi:hypothetical protein